MDTRWEALDASIRTWWDGDLRTAHEADLCHDEDDTLASTIMVFAGNTDRGAGPSDAPTLIALPCPYSTAAGSEGAFPEMYCFDTHYINSALLAHGRHDIVRGHILNQLALIERFGMVLNANRLYFRTRSQLPLIAESVWRYFQATGDRDLLHMAYPRLKQEYSRYWDGPDHRTSIGLTRPYDLGDPIIRPDLAAEAESGMDFNPCFGGNATKCVSVALNAVLIGYARVLGAIADALHEDGQVWRSAADERAALLREFCWSERDGWFFEYNYAEKRRIPVWSVVALWTIWAGAATPAQIDRMVTALPRFQYSHGFSFTDMAYPSPHPEFEQLQWSYPWGWPPVHIMIAEGFSAIGRRDVVAPGLESYLDMMITIYERTGKLWEKYNVVSGDQRHGTERYPNRPFHGWSSAAVVLLGRLLFSNVPLFTTGAKV